MPCATVQQEAVTTEAEVPVIVIKDPSPKIVQDWEPAQMEANLEAAGDKLVLLDFYTVSALAMQLLCRDHASASCTQLTTRMCCCCCCCCFTGLVRALQDDARRDGAHGTHIYLRCVCV